MPGVEGLSFSWEAMREREVVSREGGRLLCGVRDEVTSMGEEGMLIAVEARTKDGGLGLGSS